MLYIHLQTTTRAWRNIIISQVYICVYIYTKTSRMIAMIDDKQNCVRVVKDMRHDSLTERFYFICGRGLMPN